MNVYRLAREQYASPLSGVGAAIKGGRWNSVGIEMIYTAANRSLAMAEVAVHFTLATLPKDYVMITIHIPENVSSKKIVVDDLPTDWKQFPHPPTTQKIGDAFVMENKYCILWMPSVVTQGDYNVLINPNHKEFSKIKITALEPFPFDRRILK